MADLQNTTDPKTQESAVPDAHLDDEKTGHEAHFVGATLQIDGAAQNGDDPGVHFAGAFDRNRPGSVYGRQSVKSTTSRTSMRPGVVRTDTMTEKFFSYKPTAGAAGNEDGRGENRFEASVTQCQRECVKPELDGSLQGAWLLTEIDHWDLEHEKIMLLTENSLIVCKYHFIMNNVEEYKRIMLHIIDTIAIGDFQYPPYSVMPQREHGGVQIRWNHGQIPSFGQRWNPFCRDIPYATFSHHPVLYNPKEVETVTYNVDDFYESLIQATSKCYNKKRPGEKVTVIEGPIMIESYASLGSMIFNQSSLGFAMDRNGICY